jgi:hypothetical protein
MEDLTLERYFTDAQLRSDMKAAAQRERARLLKRFLEQAAQALLGDSAKAARARVERVEPCAAC